MTLDPLDLPAPTNRRGEPSEEPGPGDQEARPADNSTDAAYVQITLTPENQVFTSSVPSRHAGRMLDTSAVLAGIGGSALAPLLMAKAVQTVDGGAPWQMQSGSLLLAALLPLVYVLLNRSSD